MVDVHTQETRSRNMAAIKGANTKPELIIRKGLHAHGFRFRLHAKKLPGRPDIVLRRFNAVIFVNGCFWHGHNCPVFRWPKTRESFWRDKIGATVERDRNAVEKLQDDGWRIATVWECALKDKGRLHLPGVIDSLAIWLSSDTDRICIRGSYIG